MSTKTTILTPNGVYSGDTNFESFTLSILQGDSQLSCKISDIRKTKLWVYDLQKTGESSSSSTGDEIGKWLPFDPAVADVDSTRPDVSVWRYARAAQFDRLTGRTFFLQPFRPDSESIGMYGKITVCEPSVSTGTLVPQEYQIFIGDDVADLKYTLDMKLDVGRRKLWILDSGNNRILKVNVDTGKADMVYQPQGTSAMCSMAIDLTTGVAYVRAMGRATKT